MNRFTAFALCSTLCLFVIPQRLHADDDMLAYPAPGSANDVLSSFDRGLQGRDKDSISLDKSWGEILSHSHLKLKLRNYFFSRTQPDEQPDPLSWAQGGSLAYHIDKIGDLFSFDAEYFGSFKLYGPLDQDGALLLEPGQDNITTLGVLNPKIHIGKNVISLYRQRIDVPFVNIQDNRMVPNTFEAYVIGMPVAENKIFQYGIGYIADMKKRNQENFYSMASAAGVENNNDGLWFGAARYFFTPELSLGAAEFYIRDIYNIVYSESAWRKKINDHWSNALLVQFADQRTIGDDLTNNGNSYSTGFWGFKNSLTYKNITLKTVYTHNDTGGVINSPFGSYAGYNAGIFEDFDRAGEKAWQVGLAYNFARFGLPGLGLSSGYIHGFDAIDPDTKQDIPNNQETDVTIDYKFLDGTLKGLWLRGRAALVETDTEGTTQDFRVIVNYEIPLYDPPATPAEPTSST